MLQTSGTSGSPGVVLRPSSRVDHVACGVARQVDMRPGDRVVSLVPLSHSYGVEHGLFAGHCLIVCGTVIRPEVVCKQIHLPVIRCPTQFTTERRFD